MRCDPSYNIKLDIRPHAPFVLSFETVDIFGAPVKIPLAAMDADGLTTIYRSTPGMVRLARPSTR